ncbi:MAG: HAMP domain-containing histidine kinase [Prevotella sp.]|nr:HAMP domain-containing histidine kinase [Prevotella sp.]
MKISIICLFLAMFIWQIPAVHINAQAPSTKADELMKSGESSLKNKEYTKARYLFKQAYTIFAAQENYAQAIECGLKASALYTRENYINESFDLVDNMSRLIATGEEKLQKPLYDLRFAVTNERLRIYMRIKTPAKAKSELDKLSEITELAKNDSLEKVKLYCEADYYYTFGLADRGDASIRKLIGQYQASGQYDKADEVYRDIIETAKQNNNVSMVHHIYEGFISWTDSIKALKVHDEIQAQEEKYNESLSTIREKEDALSAKRYIITGLGLLSAILAVALIFQAIVLLRFVASNRMLKKNIRITEEHTRLKNEFIRNISGQMDPVLKAIAVSVEESGIKAPEQILALIDVLRKFCEDVQEFSILENSLSEPYEMSETNIKDICLQCIDRIKPLVRPEVSVSVDTPELRIKTNPDQLERILSYLLRNASLHTESGYIVLDVKKRGAHVYEFIITDSGAGIAEEERENLFKPFTGITSLNQDTGLGLAICSLIAIKLHGNLSLDSTYKRGCRFILKLHC